MLCLRLISCARFGVIAWSLWTQRFPWDGLRARQIVDRVLLGDQRPPIERADNMPPPVRRLIEKCWHRDPRRRPRFEQLDDENGDVHQLRSLLGLRSRSATDAADPPPAHTAGSAAAAETALAISTGTGAAGDQSDASRRSGWIPSVDERTGKMYYYNPSTGKAVWDAKL